MFCCHPRRTSEESFRRFAWRLIHSMDFTEQNLELFQKKWGGLQEIGWIDHFEFGVVINMLMLLHGRAGDREAVSGLESVLTTRNLGNVEDRPATCPSSGSLHPPRRRANCCCLTRSRHVQLVAYGATSEERQSC